MSFSHDDATIYHGNLVCEGDTTPMQFTGRTDITPSWEDEIRPGAKELYEGDIVRGWVSRYPYSKTTGEIIYNEHAQAFQLKYRNAFNGHATEFLHRYHFFEVIGNIFEHRHLLEK